MKYHSIELTLDERTKKMIESKKDLSDQVGRAADKLHVDAFEKSSYDIKINENDELIVKDLDPARILRALYNASKPVGMGFYALNSETAKQMTVEMARKYIEENSKYGNYWDYVHGRPIKVGISKDGTINPWRFDRDNGGTGSCKRILEAEFSA
jgi:hypothetical protein